MKVRHALAALAALTLSSTAAAQNLKPGLWEITHNMQGSAGAAGGEAAAAQARMKEKMANMPPEQRKMVEEMMAKKGMAPGGGGPGSGMRVCMTKEMVDRNEISPQKGDCKTTKQEKSGNTLKFAYACANPPSTGEGTYTFMGNEAYKMRMVVNSNRGGKPETMTMEGSGKWLGADCGSVKPPAMPPKK